MSEAVGCCKGLNSLDAYCGPLSDTIISGTPCTAKMLLIASVVPLVSNLFRGLTSIHLE